MSWRCGACGGSWCGVLSRKTYRRPVPVVWARCGNADAGGCAMGPVVVVARCPDPRFRKAWLSCAVRCPAGEVDRYRKACVEAVRRKAGRLGIPVGAVECCQWDASEGRACRR